MLGFYGVLFFFYDFMILLGFLFLFFVFFVFENLTILKPISDLTGKDWEQTMFFFIEYPGAWLSPT